ncbi:peroxisomal membrane protein 11A-like [Chenopodium quinoa]|uniref:peroxisomal membrane protein 11A-like n=1 Tax=Chenopodium quinoa TaxID=63459 RepID=UPI000B76D3FB|nr:peroxisomal membrane protein 11A-like [Chenopodium quinoa]
MAAKPSKDRDFLKHLEAYLAKRDGVDKLLKISRYASKFIISSSLLPHAHPVTRRLKSFESSVGLSRKAFRLGKFIQDVNALRSAAREKNQSRQLLLLSLLAYGGEGIYYFVEQIVWLSKSGLIDARHARELQKVSAWAEFVGYIGSITLKVGDLKELDEKLKCLNSSVEIADVRDENCEEEREKLKVLRLKMMMKKMSILQDFADGLMALADIRDGKGKIFTPFVLSCAGLLSALISTHKNWVSC